MNGAHYKTLLKKGNWQPGGRRNDIRAFHRSLRNYNECLYFGSKKGPLKKSSWIWRAGGKERAFKTLTEALLAAG